MWDVDQEQPTVPPTNNSFMIPIPGNISNQSWNSTHNRKNSRGNDSSLAVVEADISNSGTFIVRGEEAGIVILVLGLWVTAIGLFVHRWGKIRMLEPYQPHFKEQEEVSVQHRGSRGRMSMASEYLTFQTMMERYQSVSRNASLAVPMRPRGQSVFIDHTDLRMSPFFGLSRKVKSAENLATTRVLSEVVEVNGSECSDV